MEIVMNLICNYEDCCKVNFSYVSFETTHVKNLYAVKFNKYTVGAKSTKYFV